jgi:hypothetical protein
LKLLPVISKARLLFEGPDPLFVVIEPNVTDKLEPPLKVRLLRLGRHRLKKRDADENEGKDLLFHGRVIYHTGEVGLVASQSPNCFFTAQKTAI